MAENERKAIKPCFSLAYVKKKQYLCKRKGLATMTFEELKQITKQREKRTIEYKEAWSELPGNLFETVCAFLNRDGGVIVLGVHDDTPHPKNPHMANFFVQIGRAEHLGTGIRNLYKYVPIYTGKQPEIEDEDCISCGRLCR